LTKSTERCYLKLSEHYQYNHIYERSEEMAKVINLQKIRERKADPESRDLNELLRQAATICEEKLVFPKGVSVVGRGKLQNVFERKISQEIFARKLISRGIFLCGIYISKILTELASANPESWWAVDYAFSDAPADLKKGGDMCFALCGIFPQRGNQRFLLSGNGGGILLPFL